MATVFLHVGLADTGSAELQSHLRTDEERLRAAGVVFPRVGRDGATHDALARLLRTSSDDRDPRFLQLRRTLREELDGFAVAILSSDRFASLSGQPLRQLAGLLEGHRVVVLAYLREHLAHWSLRYERAVVQSNLSGAFDSWFALARSPFSAMVDRFAETFQRGNLLLRLVDDAVPGSHVVRDFAAATGCAVLGEHAPAPRPEPPRVGGNLLFVKRVLNSFLDVRQGARFGADVAALALTESASGPFLVDAPTARRLADLYAADRTRLARRYGLEITPRLDAHGHSASPDFATLAADWARLRAKAQRQSLPLGQLMGQVAPSGGMQAPLAAPAAASGAPAASAAALSRTAAHAALQQLAGRVAALETETGAAATRDELTRQMDDLKRSLAELRTTATVDLRRQFADYVHAIDAARRIAAAASP